MLRLASIAVAVLASVAAGGFWLTDRATGTSAAHGSVSTAPGTYKCYGLAPQASARASLVQDRFERRRMRLAGLARLCNPVQMNNEGMRNPDAHLACYTGRSAARQRPFATQRIRVRHRFGSQLLTLRRPRHVCVASLKAIGAAPGPTPNPSTLVDNLKCYDATSSTGFSPFLVNLVDQFGEARARVLRTDSYCSPVQLDRERPRQDGTGLLCFSIADELTTVPAEVTLRNRFGTRSAAPGRGVALCVPSSAIVLKRPGVEPSCKPLSIQHGGRGVISLSGSVVASSLRVPSISPERRIVRAGLGDHSWEYISLKVDGPERVVRDFVTISVLWRTSRGLKPDVVDCAVTVEHHQRRPPPPPGPTYCLIAPRFRLDPAIVPKTGFANFGATISFPGNGSVRSIRLAETGGRNGRPAAGIFQPSHAWDELINPRMPMPDGRFEQDFFVNTYWTNGNVPATPLKPVWQFWIVYSQPPRTQCGARVRFVFLRP